MPMIDPIYPEGGLSAAQRAELVKELTTVLLSAGERHSYAANTIIRDPNGEAETPRARFGSAPPTPSDAGSRTVAGFAPSPRPDRRRPSSR